MKPRPLPASTRAQLIKFAREAWPLDGAEGDTVHKLCDELELAHSQPDSVSVVRRTLMVARECVETGYTASRLVERLRECGIGVHASDVHPSALSFTNAVDALRAPDLTPEQRAWVVVVLREEAEHTRSAAFAMSCTAGASHWREWQASCESRAAALTAVADWLEKTA